MFAPQGQNTGDGDFESLDTEKATINDLTAVLEKSSDQSISSATDTTPDWDNTDVDTDIYTFDSTNDDVDVLVDGDYRVDAWFDLKSCSDQDLLQIKAIVNGTTLRLAQQTTSGTIDSVGIGVTLKDLSSNDTIRIDVRNNDSNCTLEGAPVSSFVTITRAG